MTDLQEKAMRLALERLESHEYWMDEEAIQALRTALPQPEQKPVAWSVLDKRTGKHWYTHESKYTAQHYANEYSHKEPDGSPSMIVKPLYTAPPKREWVGLKDVDWNRSKHHYEFQKGVDWAESILKEKNT